LGALKTTHRKNAISCLNIITTLLTDGHHMRSEAYLSH